MDPDRNLLFLEEFAFGMLLGFLAGGTITLLGAPFTFAPTAVVIIGPAIVGGVGGVGRFLVSIVRLSSGPPPAARPPAGIPAAARAPVAKPLLAPAAVAPQSLEMAAPADKAATDVPAPQAPDAGKVKV